MAALITSVRSTRAWAAALSILLGALLPVSAQALTSDERVQIFDQAQRTAVAGPADLKLADQAVLHLPAARGFVPVPLAHRVLEAMGASGHDATLQGIVFPSGGEGWLMTVRFVPAGLVKDADAGQWNLDDLLARHRATSDHANADRVRRGEPAIEVVGWAARPVYDPVNHRLAYGVTTRFKDVSDSVESVSLDTFVLGRHGYVAMNLMTRLDQLQRHGPSAVTLLEAIEFDVGKRYADASEAGDRRAAHGLAALVTGVPAQQAAAGPDLLALAGTHKLALAIGLALAGSAALWAVLRRRQSPAPAGATTPRT